MTKKEKEKLEAIKHLKQFIKKGDTIFTKIEKVSTSGMYRHIKVISIKKNMWLYNNKSRIFSRYERCVFYK